jgi:hypothetical protein
MSGVAGILDGLMRPRCEVPVFPPSKLENFGIAYTSMQRTSLAITGTYDLDI